MKPLFVWFIGRGKDDGRFEIVETEELSNEWIEKKMKELGIRTAMVVVWVSMDPWFDMNQPTTMETARQASLLSWLEGG